MPRFHFRVSEAEVEILRQRAKARGLSLQRYLASLVCRELESGWPANFFTEVAGGWEGESLVRAPQGDFDHRNTR